MKLYEFEGKSLLSRTGIPVPEGDVADSVQRATWVARRIGYPVALKSQILLGGRGKTGGVQFVETEGELIDRANRLFGAVLGGEEVTRLLIEKKVTATRELYLGITIDPRLSLPVMMISLEGGGDVESVAAADPDTVHKSALDPTKPLYLYRMLDAALKAGLTGDLLTQVSGTLLKLARCYFQHEALTAEINPLLITEDGRMFAADAKFEIDDSALFRRPAAQDFVRKPPNTGSLEAEAEAALISYVRVEGGNIGLISGGAGLGMATMDMICRHGGRPANFLDLGGGATREKTAAALKIVLKTPGVEGVLLNVFGGINNCEKMAQGIVQVVDELNPSLPIAIKMRGHSQEEGWALLEERNIPIVKFGTTEEAVVLLLQEMKR